LYDGKLLNYAAKVRFLIVFYDETGILVSSIFDEYGAKFAGYCTANA